MTVSLTHCMRPIRIRESKRASYTVDVRAMTAKFAA